MNRLLLWSILPLAGFGVSSAFAADDTSAPKKEAAPSQDISAPAPKPDANAAASTDKNAKSAPSSPTDANASAKSGDTAKSDAASPAETAAGKDDTKQKPAAEVLAPVEVKKGRLIEIDREIVELQDQIDREKKKTKPTEADKALNDSRVASALSIFGGSSAESRAALAKERVSLMESELELLQMSLAAKTPAERDDLRSQAAELREMRRNLERSGTGPIRDKDR